MLNFYQEFSTFKVFFCLQFLMSKFIKACDNLDSLNDKVLFDVLDSIP